MSVKTGKVEIVRQEDKYGYGGGTIEVDILAENIKGRNYVTTSVVKDSSMYVGAPYRTNTYDGINIDNEEGLMTLFGIFASNGVKSYEWLEPLTEVPSQGGSGLTIDDVYPVGIEITTTDTTFNPMKVWGDTWTVLPTGAKRVWTRKA